MDRKKNTVADLIAKLQTLDPNKKVITEGCDCIAEWDGRLMRFQDGDVMLCREMGTMSDSPSAEFV